MKHLVRGTAGLVAALGVLAGCADDPALDLAGAPTRILVNPSFLFITQGDSQAVRIRTINDLNDAVLAKYDVTDVGAGIAVGFDARYRPDYNNPGDTLAVPEMKYEQRYFVKAVNAVSASFNVRNGNLTAPVQVRVVPNAVPIAVTAGTNTVGATITAPNFRFRIDSTRFLVNGVEAPIQAVSANGAEATVALPGGLNNVQITIEGARVSYAPTVALPALLSPAISTPAATPLAGTNAFASAPTLTAAATGRWGFVDNGAFSGPDYVGGGGPTKIYKIVITADRTGQDVILDWGSTASDELADLDFFLVDGGFNAVLGSAANGNNADHPPEPIENVDLPAGEYYLIVLNYQNAVTPDWFSIRIQNH